MKSHSLFGADSERSSTGSPRAMRLGILSPEVTYGGQDLCAFQKPSTGLTGRLVTTVRSSPSAFSEAVRRFRTRESSATECLNPFARVNRALRDQDTRRDGRRSEPDVDNARMLGQSQMLLLSVLGESLSQFRPRATIHAYRCGVTKYISRFFL